MLNLKEVLSKNIKILVPRGNFSEEEKTQIFATSKGWVKMRQDGRCEVLVSMRNLDARINDIINNQKVILDENERKHLKDNSISLQQEKNNETYFDYLELDNNCANKNLKKGNLIRLHLVWSGNINIKANDGAKTYIEIFNDKDKVLGRAYYRERVNEKTLMFVYKIGKEKIDGIIKVNPKIIDGRIKDNNGILIENPNKLLVVDSIYANTEK